MSDFLARMASRSQGASPVLRPRPMSLFEGGPDLLEEVYQREAEPPAPRAPRPAAQSRPSVPSSPPPSRARADPAQRPEAAPPERPPPPPEAFGEQSLDRIEAADTPLPAPRQQAAAAASGHGSAARASVQRRAFDVPAGTAAPELPSGPFAKAAQPAASDADAEPAAAAPARFLGTVRREATRREEPVPGRAPAPAPAAVGTSARSFGREGEVAAAAAEAPPAAVPPRPGASVEARVAGPPVPSSPAAFVEARVSGPAVPPGPAVHPFAPRSGAEPAPAPFSAPVEIRIGRIDIHAAPPAAAAAPAEAPGPSLDAFLARPRR